MIIHGAQAANRGEGRSRRLMNLYEVLGIYKIFKTARARIQPVENVLIRGQPLVCFEEFRDYVLTKPTKLIMVNRTTRCGTISSSNAVEQLYKLSPVSCFNFTFGFKNCLNRREPKVCSSRVLEMIKIAFISVLFFPVKLELDLYYLQG